jgi:hypothetical protein
MTIREMQYDRAGLVEDAQVQRPGMQVDAAVELVRSRVDSHRGFLGAGGPEPVSWLEGASLLKIPRWDKVHP